MPPAGTCPTYFTIVDGAFDDAPGNDDGVRNHRLCFDWNNPNNATYTEGSQVVAGVNFDRFLGNGFSDCISPVPGGEPLDCLAMSGRTIFFFQAVDLFPCGTSNVQPTTFQ